MRNLATPRFPEANYDSILAVFRLSCLSHSCEIASPFIRPNETRRFQSGLVLKGKCSGVDYYREKSTRSEKKQKKQKKTTKVCARGFLYLWHY